MFRHLNLNDFTLVTLGPEEAERITQTLKNDIKLNQEYLDRLPELPKGGKLTGSFIYSHPPDYVGRPTMNWDVDDWREMFQELKEIGIDTVIYQAAAWAEIHECNYPSTLFSGYRMWNSLDPMIEAVAKENLILYLGGLGNLYAFDEKITKEALVKDCDQQLACYDELVAFYKGGFHGFYMSPETAFPGLRQPEREQLLNGYFRDVCQGVKTVPTEFPFYFRQALIMRRILISKFTIFFTTFLLASL